ncbi:MAG: hypothetical protein IT368_14580 [Candidatus Hydrogenedentes bacterium]|nr:hypothetical protein [Candidatus Hydrogenedentota bacterium]
MQLSRRSFIAAAAAAAALGSVKTSTAEEAPTPEMFQYSMHGFGGDDPQATAKAMKEMGFNVVVAGGDAVIAAVREQGMEAWLCGGAFGLGSAGDDQKAVDIEGNPQIWFGSGSPNSAKIREQNLKSYEDMAKTNGISGILVDGCRFASPASGLMPFLTDFSEMSKQKADTLGFDFARMKQDVTALHASLTGKEQRGRLWLETPVGVVEWLTQHPGVLDWLRFRRTCTTEHFRNIEKIIHGAGLKMGVYIFTPSLSPLVGQSYVDLAEFMDVFAPMIYRNYPDSRGEACLNWELTMIPEELGLAGTSDEEAVMSLVLHFTGLAGIVPERSIAALWKELPPEAVGHETRMARSLIGDKILAPIIYIDDPLMAKTAKEVKDNGANGLNFFVYKDNWQEMVKPAF